MPYQIIRNDIVTMAVDAIVNPTDAVFSGSGGVDARVHFAAGPQMRTACDQLPVLDMGQVAVTEGFQLPCRYVIHTFGPIWLGGGHREKELLSACYRNALHAARKLNCKTVATPPDLFRHLRLPQGQSAASGAGSYHGFSDAVRHDGLSAGVRPAVL